MKNNNKQYGFNVRISAALLGTSFISASFYIIYNLFCVPSGFGLFHIASIPMLVFAYLLLHVAWLGNDPLWFYNMWDVKEKNAE